MESIYKQKKLRNYTRPNDRKAPRMGKAEFSYNLITKQLYNQWLKEYPQYNRLTFMEFKDLWKDIADTIIEQVCSSTDGIRLPFYIGDLETKYVKSYNKAKEKNTDLEPEVEELNWNTNGKLGKIVWSVDYARKFNKACRNFCFHPHALFQDRSHIGLKENPEIFKSNRVGNSNLNLMIGRND